MVLLEQKIEGSGNMVNYANKEKYSTRMDTKPPCETSGGNYKFWNFNS